MFKEDFLMTKKGRRKLEALKKEKEQIHQSYVEAGSALEETEQNTEDDEENPQEGGDE